MRLRFHTGVGVLFLAMQSALFAAPAVPRNTVFRPTFYTASNSFAAGTAFLCQYPEGKGVILITAQHLFGPAGGAFPVELKWNELSEIIKGVTATSMDDAGFNVTSQKVVPIRGAHGLNTEGLQNDIAVFAIPSTSPSLSALKLTDHVPKPGDPVWLYGKQKSSKTVELLSATVVTSTARELGYAFLDRTVQLRATSGAPILDAAGAVVAINLGGAERAGRLVGYGNPASSIRQHLQQAFRLEP